MKLEELKIQNERLKKTKEIATRIEKLENVKNEYIKDNSMLIIPTVYGVALESKQAIDSMYFATITALHFEIKDLKKRLEEI